MVAVLHLFLSRVIVIRRLIDRCYSKSIISNQTTTRQQRTGSYITRIMGLQGNRAPFFFGICRSSALGRIQDKLQMEGRWSYRINKNCQVYRQCPETSDGDCRPQAYEHRTQQPTGSHVSIELSMTILPLYNLLSEPQVLNDLAS